MGKYPSNKQIDETLTYATTHSPVDESKLSSDGRQLIQDFRDIIETSRIIVVKKNADELLQNFLVSDHFLSSMYYVLLDTEHRFAAHISLTCLP